MDEVSLASIKVMVETSTYKLVVLADNLGGTLGEIESE